MYTRTQRAVALLYGVLAHALFAAGVGAMVFGLYAGMALGLGPFRGAAAVLVNALLVLQFPILHSFFLGPLGRKWMSRCAPLGLGRDLSTTLFAVFASFQLLVVFLLWSPSGILWYQPRGWGWIAWTVPYAASWALLIKGMNDAGLSVQMGSLGWWSVFRGRRPVNQPFEVRGLYRYVRQPVYIAFALTLWTGPVWTPDRLILALAWTAYCIVGPLFKEQRYRKHYGESFAMYQGIVPYWVPRLARIVLSGPGHRVFRRRPSEPVPAGGWEVVVAGAGPVGLLLANLLGSHGLKVLVVEKRVQRPDLSMAIGVTPPSLKILKALGLDHELVRRGVTIRKAVVHGGDGMLGGVSFSHLPGDHAYILSVPQSETIGLLEESLRRFPSVELRRGVEVSGMQDGANDVAVTLKSANGEETVRARFLAACDGARSLVRDLAGIPVDTKDYGLNFLMADFEDRGDLADEAHLFFTPGGSVESFPLPGGRRRWIVLTDSFMENAPDGVIERIVRERSGRELAGSRRLSQSPFRVRRVLARRYFSGRVVCCGDAAHVMSPIGGQGMNTGFADAEFLADALVAICRQGAAAGDLLSHYDFFRRRAFAAASARAARGMWLGTRTGRLATSLRDWAIRRLLLRPPLREMLPAYFAMLTIPFNTLERVPTRVAAVSDDL